METQSHYRSFGGNTTTAKTRSAITLLRILAYHEPSLRELALRLRDGATPNTDEAELLALFIEFHAHYPAATLAAFGGLAAGS